MREYTPTTKQVEDAFAYDPEYEYYHPDDPGYHHYNRAAFRRWLAAHDAQKRAEWEAEQGTEEPKWEYTIAGRNHPFVREDDARDLAALHNKTLFRRRKAGPWVPMEDPNRPIRHEDWCHAVTGCSEAGHCTCDGTDRPNRSEGENDA